LNQTSRDFSTGFDQQARLMPTPSKPPELVCHLRQPEATGTRAIAEAPQTSLAPRKPKPFFGLASLW